MTNLITEHMDIWTSAQIPKTNGGRGRGNSSNGQGHYGIKKLRELILELAVRGKLVPQDPKDEPASVLLEKIAKEKKRLIKEGKIKKEKPLQEIGEEEKPYELPNGWMWARLEMISEISMGQSPPGNTYNDSGDGVPLINGPVEFSSGAFGNTIKSKFTTSPTKLCKKGDLLLCVRGSTTGRTNISAFDACIGRGVATIRSKIFPMFLNWFIVSLRESIYSKGTGSTFPSISFDKIANLICPVPPINEQQRIVAKIDELMALCDQLEQQQTHSNDTHQTLVETLLATLTQADDPKEFDQVWQRIADQFDTLFTTEQSIDQLKQTILQLAVMGKLVPQDPNDLPAPQSGKFFVYALECEDKSIYIGQTEDVLKRWKEHAAGEGAECTKKHPPVRLVHWEMHDSRDEVVKREKELKTGFGRKWLKREMAAGRTRQAGEPASVLLEKITKEKIRFIKEGKNKKQIPLSEISEDEKPFELPKGWEWTRLGSISQINPRNDAEDELDVSFIPMPLISISHKGEHDQEVKLWGDIKKGYTHFANGDIGVAKITPCFENSKAVVFSNLKHGIGAGTTELHITRPYGSTLIPRYVLIFLKAPMFLKNGERKMTGTAGQKRLPKGFFSEYPFPLPPLAEQEKIVAKVDVLMELCDELREQIKINRITQSTLSDAIVDHAAA